MAEDTLGFFIVEFLMMGDSFDDNSMNLSNMWQHYEEFKPVLNWEKCHFTVKEGIVLGKKITGRVIKGDQYKLEVIKILTPPISVKGVQSFLVHAGLYMRFIKDFSKITNPLWKLLEKEVKF